MENIKLSIIVPVYNAGNKLEECVNSIISSNFQDFELIIINDGSTDSTPTICNELENNYNCIKVIHQKNSGVSSARNRGLDNAQGKYITFIDSDDYISSDLLNKMYNNIRKYNTDLVAYNSYYIDYLTKASNQRNKKIVETTYDGIYNDNEIEILIKNIIDYKKPREAFFSSACSKLFKKSIIKKNEINFNEDVIIAEDTLFVVEYLFHCNRVFCSNEPHYFYVQHSSSSTSKAITADEKWHSFKNYLNNLTDLFRNSEYSYLTENAQSLSLKSMSTVLKFIFNNSSYNSYIKKSSRNFK